MVIDVGKTFREGALRWMPHRNITSLDAVVLTHEHADAFGGLDDVRGFQRSPRFIDGNLATTAAGGQRVESSATPVFLSQQCFAAVKRQFGYLVPRETRVTKMEDPSGGTAVPPKVVRSVASLEYHVIQSFKPFIAAGLKMTPLPVMHGEDLVCFGFAFSICGQKKKKMNVVYLSDISRMLPATQEFILRGDCFEGEDSRTIDLLVVDTLNNGDRKHSVHFCLEEALELMRVLNPRKTLIVGMNCDDFPDHDTMNDILRKTNPDCDVQLAHDGLVLEVE